MAVLVVFVVVIVVVVFAVAVVASGRGDGLDAPERDLATPWLPDGPVSPADVEAVRFAIGLRGYRMNQVDDVLDRLGRELTARDDRISALEQRGHDSDSRSNGGADD
ncbi:MAG TPA: DivIVA domain-containing protein [Jiangellaceae bacterium]|nr:DivIVA domain-containing protein [Jiangellaceae bacterium]